MRTALTNGLKKACIRKTTLDSVFTSNTLATH